MPNNESRQINVMDNIRRLYNENNFRAIDINIFWACTSQDKNINLTKYISEEMIEKKQVKQYPNKIYCAVSHAKIWERLLSKKYDYGIIMEDDIRVNDNFITDVYGILNEINDFDICFLFHHPHFKRKTDNSNKYIYLVEGCSIYGNLCYILSKKGAKKLLKSLPFTDNKDIHINTLVEHKKLKSYITKKDLIQNLGATDARDKDSKLGSTIFI